MRAIKTDVPKVKNGKNKLDSLEGEIEDSIEDIKPKVVRSMNKATDCNSMLVFPNWQIANIQSCKLQIYELANYCKLQIYELACRSNPRSGRWDFSCSDRTATSNKR